MARSRVSEPKWNKEGGHRGGRPGLTAVGQRAHRGEPNTVLKPRRVRRVSTQDGCPGQGKAEGIPAQGKAEGCESVRVGNPARGTGNRVG